MAYKIAIASIDGINTNEHFGCASSFYIVNVKDDGSYQQEERREVNASDMEEAYESRTKGKNCRSFCETQMSGCRGHSETRIQSKIEAISDCRCLICAKCGSGAQRQLERKAITVFQIELPIEEALNTIIHYYTKVDNHISLRKIVSK